MGDHLQPTRLSVIKLSRFFSGRDWRRRPGRVCNRWLDQVRPESGTPPVDLWRRAFRRVRGTEVTQPVLAVGQWVMGQIGQQIWVGHVGQGSVPATVDPLYIIIVLIRCPM